MSGEYPSLVIELSGICSYSHKYVVARGQEQCTCSALGQASTERTDQVEVAAGWFGSAGLAARGEDQSEPPASDIAAGRPANSEPPSRPQGKFPASQGSARGKNDKRNWCRCGQNLVRCLPELQFLHPGLV